MPSSIREKSDPVECDFGITSEKILCCRLYYTFPSS